MLEVAEFGVTVLVKAPLGRFQPTPRRPIHCGVAVPREALTRRRPGTLKTARSVRIRIS